MVEKNIDVANTEIVKLETEKKIIDQEIETNFHSVNMSTQVIIKSLLTSFKAITNEPLGYGINNYELAYFKYNPKDLKKSFFSVDTFYINYNDAGSNFPKLITEFGLFSIFIFAFGAYIFFNPKYDLRYKIIFFPLIITQCFRGAGYFNSGFSLSLFILLMIYLEKNVVKK